MTRELITTNDKCIGCNKCVRSCNSPGASVSSNMVDGHFVIDINHDRCVACGACLDVCDREARSFYDDTEAFFEDLKKGESISLLVAPSFAARYPDKYAKILGGLKKLGAKRIISVAFGADICTWMYLKLIREKGYYGRISTPCPVVVSYVEHCCPELRDCLMPVLSPMMCAARYVRDEMGITDRLAFIGPCIGKRMEMDRYPDMVQYNVTFERLLERVAQDGITGEDASGEIEYGLGTYYPSPGGLADNIRWFLGDDTPVRVVSGKRYLFRWLKNNAPSIVGRKDGFALIDALNCHEGCIEGTATPGREESDEGLSVSERIRTRVKSTDPASPWNPGLTPEERLANLDRAFGKLDPAAYMCDFEDLTEQSSISTPTEEEAEGIFNSMYKFDYASRHINCSACGYGSCYEMMVAIYNGFNNRRNCVYCEREEIIRLERESYSDQLTSVMNRNAYEKLLSGTMFAGKPIGVIAADVNGLKYTNDNYGHAAGDKLIINCADTLRHEFGREHVYRTGGDEFMVILQDCYEDEVIRGIERIRARLKELDSNMALGYSFVEKYTGDFKALHDKADEVMYADKARYYEESGHDRRRR